MEVKQLRASIYAALVDAKAKDICMLDVRKVCDFTDYMVIVSGTSSRHVQSIADKTVESLAGQGCKPLGIEGRKIGDWVLIDLGDVVIHVLRPEVRDFYNLEKLWGDGKTIKFGGRR